MLSSTSLDSQLSLWSRTLYARRKYTSRLLLHFGCLPQVELEKRLRNRKDMEAELLSLTASMSDVLHVGHSEAQQLAEAVQSTATEAEKVGLPLVCDTRQMLRRGSFCMPIPDSGTASALQVSQRVRKLDTAQSNLVATIEQIKLALECGTCVSAVQAALDSQDYEAAAARISEYQSLQDQLPSGPAVPAALPSAAYADQVVGRAREKLLEVVRDKVGAAREAGDLSAMLRFLKLYKPLDVPQEGMAAAISFVRRCWSCMPSLHSPGAVVWINTARL